MTEKTTSQVLQEARALIETGWWAVGQARPAGRRVYCLAGAVMAVANRGQGNYWHARDALAGALPAGETAADSCSALVAYNDAPGRTREQVLALFDRALVEVTK